MPRSFDANEYVLAEKKVAVVSGPSGVGKGALIDRFRDHIEKSPWGKVDLIEPTSYTTRRPDRPGDINGVNYNFVTLDEFEDLWDDRVIFERNCFAGNHYGAPAPFPIVKALQGAAIVLYELEVVGARALLKDYPEAMWVGILPPSDKELLIRLEGRGTETEEKIRERMDYWFEVERPALTGEDGLRGPDIQIINDNLERAGLALMSALEFGKVLRALVD